VSGRAFYAATGERAPALDFHRAPVKTGIDMKVLNVKLTSDQHRRFARARGVRYEITVNATAATGQTASTVGDVIVRPYRKAKPFAPPDPDIKRAETAVEHDAEFIYGDQYFARADCRVRIRNRYFTCDVTILPRGAEPL
jgi:hypothetical protein